MQRRSGLIGIAALLVGACGGSEEPGIPDAAPDASPPTIADATVTDDVDASFPAEIGEGPGGDERVHIGTGAQAWVGLVHGDPLRWEAGVQGGHHAWLAVAVDPSLFADLDSEQREAIRTRFYVQRADETVLASAWRTGGYRLGEQEQFELFGGFAVLEPGLRPGRLDGEALRVTVRVEIGSADARESYAWVVSQCCD